MIPDFTFVFDRTVWQPIINSNTIIGIRSRRMPSCTLYMSAPRDFIGESVFLTNLYGFTAWFVLRFDQNRDQWFTHFYGSPEGFLYGFLVDFVSSGDVINECTSEVLAVLGTMQLREEQARNCDLIAQAPYRPGETVITSREVQAYQWPRWAMSAWMQSLPPGTTLRILGQPVCAATPQGPTLAWPVQWAGGQGWVLQAELDGVVGKPPAQAFPKGEPPVMWRKWCAEAPPSWMAVGVQGEVCTKEDRVRIRSKPGRKGGRIAWAYPGMRFRVIGGPECGDGWVWWEVEFENGIVGWIAEGPDRRDPKFICPLSP